MKDRVVTVLNNSKLTQHAFDIKFGSEGEDLITIRYLLREIFRFSASVKRGGGYTINRAPGTELVSMQTITVTTAGELISQLNAWVESVQAEDDVDPEIDTEVSKLKEAFFRDLGRHVADENKHFTRGEAEELVARVEELERRIEQIMAEQKKSQTEIRSVKSLMGQAKADVGTMTKKKWLVAGGGKIFNALISIATSREGRRAIVDSVKGLLENKTP